MEASELKAIVSSAEKDQAISPEQALAVLKAGKEDFAWILAAANSVRERHFGNQLDLCSILNARSGACPEDCSFCAQASCHSTHVETIPLASKAEITQAYEAAAELPINHFGVVTSGCALTSRGIDRIIEGIREKTIPTVGWCASLGCLKKDELARLKEAGLKRFHHNLETAESFFPEVCTTHRYQERLDTVRDAIAVGLEVCCGGILGLGESLEQRVEFAFTLAREAITSIPLNFLIPVPGTRLESRPLMKPLDILRAVAMFRLVNPAAGIKVCAGRINLRDLQSMIFTAGANGMMVGDLLTVAGRDSAQDLQMLRDLEFDFRA